MPHVCFRAVAALAVAAALARAENPQPSDPLDVRTYPLVLREPGMDAAEARENVVYLAPDGVTCDLFLPAQRSASRPIPVVVFANGVGDAAGQPSLKDWTIYEDWARLMAARGLAGVTMSARHGRTLDDLAALVAYLQGAAARHGLDAARIGIYACSANVGTALPYLMERAPEAVRAAVICYGNAAVERFHPTLPLLYVVAGRDNPFLVAAARDSWTRALDAGAPWTLAYAPTLPHAFDGVDHSPESLAAVRQIADFFQRRLTADDPPFDEAAEPLAERAMRLSYGNDANATAAAWLELLDERPDDVTVKARAGSRLLQAGDARRAAPLLEAAVRAPGAEAGDWRDYGRALFLLGRERDAVPWLEQAVTAGFEDSMVLGMLGHAALTGGDSAGGVRWYERAFAAGIPPGAATQGVAAWNLACGYARTGRADDAFAKLQLAREQGFGTKAELAADADLASLRSDPRWQALVEAAPERR